MKITSIEYRELQTHNYENETVGMTAELEEGDDVENAMARLREAVRAELARATQERSANETYSRQLGSDIYSLDRQKRNAEIDLKHVTEELGSRTQTLLDMRELFTKYGIEFAAQDDHVLRRALSASTPLKGALDEGDRDSDEMLDPHDPEDMRIAAMRNPIPDEALNQDPFADE